MSKRNRIARNATNNVATNNVATNDVNAKHDANEHAQIESLLRELHVARANENKFESRKSQKMIRRKLRALSYYNATRTRSRNDTRIALRDTIVVA